MDAYRTRISALEKEIKKNTTVIADSHLAVGEVLFEKKRSALSDEKFSEVVENAGKLTQELTERKNAIERIREIDRKIDETNATIDDTRTAEKEINQDLGPVYEAIGEKAYSVYRANALTDTEYDEAFEEPAKLTEELIQIDHDLLRHQSELESKPILEKMVVRGKIVLLKNRKAARQSALPRAYRKTGELIAASGFIESVKNPSLNDTAAPYFEAAERLEALREKRERLTTEIAELETELEALGVEKKVNRRVHELETRIGEIQSELNECFRRIGELYLSDDAAEIYPEIKEHAERIKTCIEQNRENEALIDKLNAAIQIRIITDDVARMQNQIAGHQRQIEESNAKIAEFESSIESSEKEKKRLIKVRGPEEGLLE